MTPVRPSFRTSVRPASTVVVLAVLANLACVCAPPVATARGAENAAGFARGKSHSCCKHRDPAAGESHQAPARHVPAGHGGNSDCPHCGTGAAALERPDTSHVTKLNPAHLKPFTGDCLPLVPCQRLTAHFRREPARPLHPPAPSTLLGLHCALNG